MSSSTFAGRSNGNEIRKFELPALAPLSSLTAGTDIPPPLESPVEESPAFIVSSESRNAAAEAISTHDHDDGGNNTASRDAYDDRGRMNGDTSPTSPLSPKRPSSIRRFLSHRSLNRKYSNQSQENLSLAPSRPESSGSYGTTAGGPPRSAKRSSSWFGRFTGSGMPESQNKRASIVYEEKPVAKGPPPPRLPELNQLKAKVDADQNGSWDVDDMFKNIK